MNLYEVTLVEKIYYRVYVNAESEEEAEEAAYDVYNNGGNYDDLGSDGVEAESINEIF